MAEFTLRPLAPPAMPQMYSCVPYVPPSDAATPPFQPMGPVPAPPLPAPSNEVIWTLVREMRKSIWSLTAQVGELSEKMDAVERRLGKLEEVELTPAASLAEGGVGKEEFEKFLAGEPEKMRAAKETSSSDGIPQAVSEKLCEHVLASLKPHLDALFNKFDGLSVAFTNELLNAYRHTSRGNVRVEKQTSLLAEQTKRIDALQSQQTAVLQKLEQILRFQEQQSMSAGASPKYLSPEQLDQISTLLAKQEWQVEVTEVEENAVPAAPTAPRINEQDTDYQMQLKLLEEQCKKRCVQAQQERDAASRLQNSSNLQQSQDEHPNEDSSETGTSQVPTKSQTQPDYSMQIKLLEEQNKKRSMQIQQERYTASHPQSTIKAWQREDVQKHEDAQQSHTSRTPTEGHSQVEYEMQLRLLEEQNKKRLMQARQEQARCQPPDDMRQQPMQQEPKQVYLENQACQPELWLPEQANQMQLKEARQDITPHFRALEQSALQQKRADEPQSTARQSVMASPSGVDRAVYDYHRELKLLEEQNSRISKGKQPPAQPKEEQVQQSPWDFWGSTGMPIPQFPSRDPFRKTPLEGIVPIADGISHAQSSRVRQPKSSPYEGKVPIFPSAQGQDNKNDSLRVVKENERLKAYYKNLELIGRQNKERLWKARKEQEELDAVKMSQSGHKHHISLPEMRTKHTSIEQKIQKEHDLINNSKREQEDFMGRLLEIQKQFKALLEDRSDKIETPSSVNNDPAKTEGQASHVAPFIKEPEQPSLEPSVDTAKPYTTKLPGVVFGQPSLPTPPRNLSKSFSPAAGWANYSRLPLSQSPFAYVSAKARSLS